MAASTLFLFLFLFLFLTILAQYTSSSNSEILLLPLTHSLSLSQFNSTPHLLKATSARSATRFHRRAQHLHHRQISLPLSPGSDYTLSFAVGSHPPQQISLYMDTGSDLVWFPCSPFQCILCEGKSDPSTAIAAVPNITASATAVHCKSPACSAAHSSLSSSDLCAIARCPLESIETSDCSSFSCPNFYYAYGDGSLIARLYRDVLSMRTSPSLNLENFTFGCAHSALAEPIGVAGFGRGVLSLPAQLATFSPQLGNRFSYCLVSHSFEPARVRRPSPLILGRYDDKEKIGSAGGEFVYTRMLNNPKHPYLYCVGLEGIAVGKAYIPAPAFLRRVDAEGNGGVVVDSGTTFTMLPSKLFESVATELDRRVGRVYKRAADTEDRTGLGPCYYLGDGAGRVPQVSLHLAGNSSVVVLPRKNYFYEFLDGRDGVGKKRRVGCLMLMNGGDEAESGGPGATLGNYQQQGFEVVYDLEERKVGFARRKCASLWDSLNHS
ncbi:probable aspartyl protease At4g16563 [Malania oleifera]|uniref:probable aspartyl protease At4g16563 n=1 Tax=Malania oleifera TaxID=397392 RepID=UPI0025AE3517|nr:probable aspartyl protease At4g16563 [Malania oleifera]